MERIQTQKGLKVDWEKEGPGRKDHLSVLECFPAAQQLWRSWADKAGAEPVPGTEWDGVYFSGLLLGHQRQTHCVGSQLY